MILDFILPTLSPFPLTPKINSQSKYNLPSKKKIDVKNASYWNLTIDSQTIEKMLLALYINKLKSKISLYYHEHIKLVKVD